MFNSQLLPLLLAISFSIAAPADSAAPTVRLEPLLNLTEASVHAIRSTGITDPAATFNAFTTTDCDGTIYSISPRDGECWAMININSIDIQEFFGSCYAIKVWSGADCTGEEATLGIRHKCWSTNTRHSMQVFCD